MTEEERLLEIWEKAGEEYDKTFSNAPHGLDFNAFWEYMRKASSNLGNAIRNYRLIQTPKIDEEKDVIGDKMPLKKFIDMCESCGLLNYDGFGVYSMNGHASNVYIYPNDIKHGCVRSDFDEVIWYNK